MSAPAAAPVHAHRVTFRVRPLAGEIGSLSSCPLCAPRADSACVKPNPPCLACREELRSRLLEDFLQSEPYAHVN